MDGRGRLPASARAARAQSPVRPVTEPRRRACKANDADILTRLSRSLLSSVARCHSKSRSRGAMKPRRLQPSSRRRRARLGCPRVIQRASGPRLRTMPPRQGFDYQKLHHDRFRRSRDRSTRCASRARSRSPSGLPRRRWASLGGTWLISSPLSFEISKSTSCGE